MKNRALILVAVLLAYGSTLYPEHVVLSAGLRWLGHPGYSGWRGLFLPHLLLYSTLPAAICAILWYALYRYGALPGLQLNARRVTWIAGAAGGFAALAAIIGFVGITTPASIHWAGFNALKIFANVFSNFYEEFIFRGFMLTALTTLLSFWPAAVISSALWAAQHTQYPVPLQITIGAIGILWCWLVRRTRSFLAAYEAHMVLDIFGDALIP